MAKVDVKFNNKLVDNFASKSSERVIALYINDKIFWTNGSFKLAKAANDTNRAAQKESGKSIFSNWTPVDLNATGNTVEVRKRGLKDFTPSKKPVSFDAPAGKRILIKAEKRGFLGSLFSGPYKISVKYKNAK